MQATVNPLRRPKPARERCVLRGRFYFADEQGKLASGVGTGVCLTAEGIWVTAEIWIPLELIQMVAIVSKRGFPPRRYLLIRYLNPITRASEAVGLCKPDPVGIGLYRVRPLEQ